MAAPFMKFKPPGPKERERALGPLDEDVSEALRRAYDPSGFEPMPEPGPQDWLALHSETGQTFISFKRRSFHRPDPARERIYLRPFGRVTPASMPVPLEKLARFAGRFFGLKVHIDDPVDLEARDFTTRLHPDTGKIQLLATDLLYFLSERKPADAFCVLGITMEDLYPEPSWNFVFGLASSGFRAGVYSFARYDPLFYGEPRKPEDERLMVRRCCKVLAHETAHMFGLLHCIYYRCLMNGSNHLDESDRRPIHLCPVCLRKLQHAAGFSIVDHYRGLLQFYNSEPGFQDEALWVKTRLIRIMAGEQVDRSRSDLSSLPRQGL